MFFLFSDFFFTKKNKNKNDLRVRYIIYSAASVSVRPHLCCAAEQGAWPFCRSSVLRA